MDRESYKEMAEIWAKRGKALDKIHDKELREYIYNPKDADAVLNLINYYHGPERTTSGFVEMQRIFRSVKS